VTHMCVREENLPPPPQLDLLTIPNWKKKEWSMQNIHTKESWTQFVASSVF
jgi:hypothetical protein